MRLAKLNAAQVHLLQVAVEPALGEEVLLRQQLLGEQRHLRQRRGVRHAGRLGHARQPLA